MTDNNDQFDKFKNQAKDTANEIGAQAKDAAEQAAAKARELSAKYAPQAKDAANQAKAAAGQAAAKAKAHPKFKLFAAIGGAVVAVLLVVALLPSGPSNSDVEKALRAQMIEQAKQLNGFVDFFGGNKAAHDDNIEEKINAMNIDVEILDKEETGKNTWSVEANVIVEEGDDYQEDVHTFGMRKTKKGWNISSGL